MEGHKEKLKTFLEYVVNGETDAASDIIHDVCVSKSRDIYNKVMERQDQEIDIDLDDIKQFSVKYSCVEEGATKRNSIIVEADDEIEAEEKAKVDLSHFYDEDSYDIESVEDFEDFDIDDLEYMDNEYGRFDSDEDDDLGLYVDNLPDVDVSENVESFMKSLESEVNEAFKFMNDVPDPGMENEDGAHAGTEDNTESLKPGKESPYTKTTEKTVKDGGAKPVDFTGEEGKGGSDRSAKDHTPEDNVKVKQEKAPKAKEDEKSVSSHAGAGETQTKSPVKDVKNYGKNS